MREGRIVRERWLRGVSSTAPLPDFRPHLVYAQARDVRNAGSYFYDPSNDTAHCQDNRWKAIREDWTPAAEADDAAT